MKKILSIILPLLLVVACAAYVSAQNSQKEAQNMTLTDKKVLVAYFSWGGNTKSIAEKIQAKTGADIFRIEPATPYPQDYNETAYGIAKEQKDKNIHPPINNIFSNYARQAAFSAFDRPELLSSRLYCL